MLGGVLDGPTSSDEGCEHVIAQIITVAGRDSWEAGFAEAVFTIGEKLSLLFQPRFGPIWQQVGLPPGPWVALTLGQGPSG